MVITCNDFENFIEIIYALVEKGLKFNADGDKFIITLTGGH